MTLKILRRGSGLRTILQSVWYRAGKARYYTALFQAEDPVATSCEGQIVSDENGSELMGSMQAFQQFENHFAGPEIEIARRFVGEQDGRLPDQRASQHDSLLL